MPPCHAISMLSRHASTLLPSAVCSTYHHCTMPCRVHAIMPCLGVHLLHLRRLCHLQLHISTTPCPCNHAKPRGRCPSPPPSFPPATIFQACHVQPIMPCLQLLQARLRQHVHLQTYMHHAMSTLSRHASAISLLRSVTSPTCNPLCSPSHVTPSALQPSSPPVPIDAPTANPSSASSSGVASASLAFCSSSQIHFLATKGFVRFLPPPHSCPPGR